MERRDFLKLAGLAGLSAGAPLGIGPFARQAFAQEMPGQQTPQPAGYEGPLYLSIHCGGGWDPTSFCDPKGYLREDEEDPMNHYAAADIRTPSAPSPIRWAPFGENEAFFSRHYDKLLVVNGVDTSTNNHDSGTRYVSSGLLEEGYPAFTALVAAVHGSQLPLAFITNGGYDITRGVVARTRLGNVGAMQRITEPNRIDSNNTFHSAKTMERIVAANNARTERLLGRQELPALQRAVARFQLARSSGLTVSANLSTGGFDTHGDHDNRQAQALNALTRGLNEIWQEVERQGLEERVLIAVGSDFGRTPGYNDGNGKDHWPITSMVFMGAGITGNRVIGETDPRHRALKLNPQTFALDPNGIHITPSHVHRALREMAGMSENIVAAQFGIRADLLPLFG